MRALIFEKNEDVKKSMQDVLKELEFDFLIIDNEDNIAENLQTKKFCLLVLGADEENYINLVNGIKKEFFSLPIILHTNNQDNDFIASMLDVGVCHIILKPYVDNLFTQNFFKIITKVNLDGSERRKHVRVNVDPNDVPEISIKLVGADQGNILKGEIKNFSMGGFFCEIKEKAEGLTFINELSDVTIKFSDSQMKCSAIIIMRRDNLFACQFKSLSQEAKIVLGKYIFKRIISTENL